MFVFGLTVLALSQSYILSFLSYKCRPILGVPGNIEMLSASGSRGTGAFVATDLFIAGLHFSAVP